MNLSVGTLALVAAGAIALIVGCCCGIPLLSFLTADPSKTY